MKKYLLLAAASAALFTLEANAADGGKKKAPFVAADTDNDGKVSQTEFVAAVKNRMDETAAKAKFAEIDADKDGSLTRKEFAGAIAEKRGGKKKKDEAK